MVYNAYKKLVGKTASDELLREKASKIANNPKLNRYQGGYNS